MFIMLILLLLSALIATSLQYPFKCAYIIDKVININKTESKNTLLMLYSKNNLNQKTL